MKKLLILMSALMIMGATSVYGADSSDAGSGDKWWDWVQYFRQLRYNEEQAQ